MLARSDDHRLHFGMCDRLEIAVAGELRLGAFGERPGARVIGVGDGEEFDAGMRGGEMSAQRADPSRADDRNADLFVRHSQLRQFTGMPAAFTTFAHFGTSARMWAAKASGVSSGISNASASRRLRTSGSLSTRSTS